MIEVLKLITDETVKYASFRYPLHRIVRGL